MSIQPFVKASAPICAKALVISCASWGAHRIVLSGIEENTSNKKFFKSALTTLVNLLAVTILSAYTLTPKGAREMRPIVAACGTFLSLIPLVIVLFENMNSKKKTLK